MIGQCDREMVAHCDRETVGRCDGESANREYGESLTRWNRLRSRRRAGGDAIDLLPIQSKIARLLEPRKVEQK